jgi:hypothetical protein
VAQRAAEAAARRRAIYDRAMAYDTDLVEWINVGADFAASLPAK